jgi:hypothetical protein
MIHEPDYESGPYGSYPSTTYGEGIDGCYGSTIYGTCLPYGSHPPPYSKPQEPAPFSYPPSQLPVSRAYVTLIGTNEVGTSRLIYLSKIQSVALKLDAIELQQAWVTFRFQAGRSLPEIVHLNDGCRI